VYRLNPTIAYVWRGWPGWFLAGDDNDCPSMHRHIHRFQIGLTSRQLSLKTDGDPGHPNICLRDHCLATIRGTMHLQTLSSMAWPCFIYTASCSAVSVFIHYSRSVLILLVGQPPRRLIIDRISEVNLIG